MVDMLGNEVEISWLTAMEVLIKQGLYPEAVQDSLTKSLFMTNVQRILQCPMEMF